MPLLATTIEAAKAEMADVRKQKGAEGLPETGMRPLFSEYADAYLRFHTNADSGKKPRTVAREGHSLVHWKKTMGNARLDKITRPMIAGFVKARLEAGATPRTANLDVIVLRNVLKQAQEEGLIRRLPMVGLKPRKVKTPVDQAEDLPRGVDDLDVVTGKKNGLLSFLRLARSSRRGLRWRSWEAEHPGSLDWRGRSGLALRLRLPAFRSPARTHPSPAL